MIGRSAKAYHICAAINVTTLPARSGANWPLVKLFWAPKFPHELDSPGLIDRTRVLEVETTERNSEDPPC